MNLADTLVYADINQLYQLASSWRLECNLHSKHELIQSLHNRLTSTGFCRGVHEKLNWEEKRFLLSLLFEPRKDYSREALLSRARKAFREEIRHNEHERLLTQALENGWLFRMKKAYTVTYTMPDDLRRRWREIFVKEVRDAAYGNNTKPDVYRDDTYVMAYDTHQLLRYVQTNRVPLSKEGVMYRKQQQKLMELMSVREDLVDGKEWRFGYGRRFRDYPDRLALLYDFAYHEQWLKEREEGLVVTEEGINQALEKEQEREEIAARLVAFWILSYKKAIPTVESLWMFIACTCETEWLEEAKLVYALRNWVRPFYYDSDEEVVHRRLLSMMVHLGILRRGMVAQDSFVYTITNWGKFLLNKS
jgi:hypothetical protein